MNKRPVNLNLMTMKFPITAITSITHRVTGVILFLSLPFLLCLLSHSLKSPATFDATRLLISKGWMDFLLWVVLSSTAFHVIAGIRHILMDFGLGESLKGGKITAALIFLISAVFIVLAGVWLW